MADSTDLHRRHAEALRAATAGASGRTDASLRAAVMGRAAGGGSVEQPYDSLTQQIAGAAYRVTDAQVEAVRTATGSDKGAFEIIMAASIGAGLARWDAAMRAIEGEGNAPA